MKIIICLVCGCFLTLLAGCATSATHMNVGMGSSSEIPEVQSQTAAFQQHSGLEDYRTILSDPGMF
jgi:hypothetical protein